MDGLSLRSGRFLLAMAASTEGSDDFSENFTFGGLSVAVGGALCIVCVVLMCVCKASKQQDKAPDVELQQSSEEREKKPVVLIKQNGADVKPKTVAMATENGGKASTIAILPGKPHPASFTPPPPRPTNARVLPAPPISDLRLHNKILAGTEHYSDAVISGDKVHHADQHHSSINSRNVGTVELEPQNDVYDHLGLKPSVKPSDYDCVSGLKGPESNILKTEVSGGSDDDDDDYTELDEKPYPVIINVSNKKTELLDSNPKVNKTELLDPNPTVNKTELLDPNPKVKDVDDFKSEYCSQAREEDVYNNIGDSGETVPTTLRHYLKQSVELDNPYDVVQDDSAGEFKAVMEGAGVLRGTELNRINPPTSNNLRNSSSLLHENGQNGEEYAVVQKTKSRIMNAEEIDEFTAKERGCSNASAAPPEPPRLYSISDSLEALSATGTSPKSGRKHNYAIVTARESLASISERKNRNLYKEAADAVENMYTTVEGRPGDGNAIGRASSSTDESGLISDTYYEIAISGKGVCSSLMNKAISSEQISNRNNILPTISSSADSLSKLSASNSGHVQRNPHISFTGEGENRLNHSMDAQDYENTAGSYVTLKTDSYPHTFGLAESRDLVANSRAGVDCVPGNRVTEIVDDYPDYESVDAKNIHGCDLKYVNNAFDSSVDSSGNKKVGQRRRKLDH